MEDLEQLMDLLEYTFRNKDLLRLALTHPSLLREGESIPRNNQRLEFLGDAVLQLSLTSELYEKHPDMGEGPLTKARAQMVNHRSLASLGRRLNLGDHLHMSRGEACMAVAGAPPRSPTPLKPCSEPFSWMEAMRPPAGLCSINSPNPWIRSAPSPWKTIPKANFRKLSSPTRPQRRPMSCSPPVDPPTIAYLNAACAISESNWGAAQEKTKKKPRARPRSRP